MKFFRYLLALEISTIILIALFWEEGKSNREIYQIIISYFQNDLWIISTKYYETSKIISSITTLFIFSNTIYLIIWVYLNRKKTTKNYSIPAMYESDTKTILSVLFSGPLFLLMYLKPIKLSPYKTNYYVPSDGIVTTTLLDIGLLITNSIFLTAFILGIYLALYKTLKYVKSL